MTTTAPVGLADEQRAVLEAWLPGFRIERDHSWGLTSTVVLEVEHDGRRLVVKAADPRDGHFPRGVRAHRSWLGPWVEAGRAPRLLHLDEDTRILVTEFVPGDLVLGGPHELDPDVHRQAGALLAMMHGQGSVVDDTYCAREQATTLAWLDRPHRIAPETAARVRDVVEAWDLPPAVLVPTHGDWQPRNWVLDGGGAVHAIDFGRADLRPAATDFARLAAQQFRADPALEQAFVSGYGVDPREPAAWRRHLLREAVSTAAWAHQVGDEPFERQGLRMVDEALARVEVA
ncbi:aminoglycoside phosphotransferase [Knoellia flava TL1]|uniref:Aminoglycoside phosphotransferase n=1 Tax=Knoellia flava TL1 TaxID=1385518 RepID=A0ABR4XCC5_9MICO|nr:aminoglycoside phosphotransferase [Knoellia flava TL1]